MTTWAIAAVLIAVVVCCSFGYIASSAIEAYVVGKRHKHLEKELDLLASRCMADTLKLAALHTDYEKLKERMSRMEMKR